MAVAPRDTPILLIQQTFFFQCGETCLDILVKYGSRIKVS